jgi:hypothetical protein
MTDRDRRLDQLLGALPTEASVPPGLDASALRRARAPLPRPTPGPAPWLRVAAALALGALLGASATASRPAPEIVLANGSQLVTGSARVLAGDRAVTVRGRALITVEPAGPLAREEGQEADTMKTTHLAAALAGSLVTVAVYEGRAAISGEGAVTVAAGETRSVGALPPPPTPRVAGLARDPEASTVPEAMSPEEAVAAIDALEREIAGLRARHALAEGQLAQVTGDPQPWPEDLPAAFLPAQFERSMRQLVAEEGAGELLTVDCSEFPCLTVLRPAAWDGDGLPPQVQAVVDGMQELLGESGVSVSNSRMRDGDQDLLLTGLGFVPPGVGDEARTRADYRMEGHLKGLADELMGPGGGDEADQDIRPR